MGTNIYCTTIVSYVLGSTGEIPTLPQEDEDSRERKEQILQAKALYRWNSTVRQRVISEGFGHTFASGVNQRIAGVPSHPTRLSRNRVNSTGVNT